MCSKELWNTCVFFLKNVFFCQLWFGWHLVWLRHEGEHKSCRWMSKLLWYVQLKQTNELLFIALLRGWPGVELLFRALKRGRPGFQPKIELWKEVNTVCLFSPKWKYIYFGFQQGLDCLESKNRTICERKSAMSSLDPSIIRFYSFNGRTCVPL